MSFSSGERPRASFRRGRLQTRTSRLRQPVMHHALAPLVLGCTWLFPRAKTGSRAPPLHPANRRAGQLLGGLEVKLLFDVGAVGLHRFDADDQGVSDFAAGLGRTDQIQDLEFAVRKLADERIAVRFYSYDFAMI